jgi:peroxiredoxin
VLIGISRYDAAETASWLESNPWSFPLLVDGAPVVRRYGIVNPAQDQRPGREGLPHPATFIIDKEGVIRFINVWEDYKKRTSAQTILEELDKIP